ncbi:threonylcarbamoyl-AMP synthase [Candidatus Uhrbacteria bacterium]|nr:threonylcarbamoyl-AMP synthase [Candidatus Uhrbacteria bacterium]
MKTIILTKKNWRAAIQEAVVALLRGRVVAYPTETSYGLGADATNKQAVRKVFWIKDREKARLLSVLVANKTMVRRYAKFTESAERLWDAFLPGPLTIVIPGRWGGTIGIRLSAHPFASALAKAIGRPMTATSANISGDPSISDAGEILSIFSGRLHKPDLLIDAGVLPSRRPSTVVDCTGERAQLLRKGPIPFLRIKEILQ